MQMFLLAELIGGVVDEMKDVDKDLKRDDELVHGQVDLITRHLYLLFRGATVPLVA